MGWMQILDLVCHYLLFNSVPNRANMEEGHGTTWARCAAAATAADRTRMLTSLVEFTTISATLQLKALGWWVTARRDRE